MSLEYFTNEKYKILKILFDYEVSINDKRFSPLSQDDIATICKIGKNKVNKIINELIRLNYVVRTDNKRGSYSLTDRSHSLIYTINSKESIKQ